MLGEHYDTEQDLQQFLTSLQLMADFRLSPSLSAYISGIATVDWIYDLKSSKNSWRNKRFNESRDNLYFDDDENRDYDYITLISPGIMAGIEWKSLGLELSYNPSYSNYNRYDGNNSMRQDAEFIGWAAITRNTRLNISDNYVRTEDPVTSREDYDYIRRSRYLYHSNDATIEFVTQLSPSDSISLGYNNGLLENDDPDIEDNSSHKLFHSMPAIIPGEMRVI